ncbi:MAG TPA: hypothetical protein VIL46_06440 [Gemmataceae bacterium]
MARTLFLLVGALLALPALGRGAEPRPDDAGTLPKSGKVLLLRTHMLLEGDIERVGNGYRVRRTVGETTIPAGQVLFLCGSRKEAYEYLCGQTNLRDADERIKLSRWCLAHGLREEALAEARAAAALRPSSAEARRMVRGLEDSLAGATAQPDVGPPAPGSPPAPPAEVPEPSGYNTESFKLFVTKVQPILMNTCASCHASDRAEKFRLVRVYPDNRNRRATYHNLAAALAQVDRDDPTASPLLTKALVLHGPAAHPPIPDRQSAPYRLLEQWVRHAVTPEGSPAPELTPPEAETAGEPPNAPPGVVGGFLPRGGAPAGAPAQPGFFPLNPAQPNTAGTNPGVPRAPDLADPFDPALFNRTLPRPVPGPDKPPPEEVSPSAPRN